MAEPRCLPCGTRLVETRDEQGAPVAFDCPLCGWTFARDQADALREALQPL